MSDPMDELEHFTTPGLTMTPLSASEVRRRGTRMRRRNHALATVGGIAAVAIIATPIALAATGDSADRTPPPAGPSGETAWLKLIPESFDLTSGIGGDDPDAEERTKVGDPDAGEDSLGVTSVTFCGAEAWTPGGGTVDRRGATYAEPSTESSNKRTLALYADGAAADAAYEAIRQAATDCPESTTDSGDTELTEVRDADLGSEESFVVVKQWQASDEDSPSLGSEIIQVARTGNSVLVTEAPSINGDQLDPEVERQAEFTAPVAQGMDAFAAQPTRAVDDGDQASDGTTIPAAFPLLEGLPTDDEAADEGFGREGPSTGLDPIVLTACGSSPDGLPAPAETLRAGWRDVGGTQQRALMTFTSEADATAYVDRVTGFYSGCGVDDQGGIAKVYHVLEEAAGDQSRSVVMGVEVDGEAGLGMEVVQVVRVGQSVLLVQVIEEENIVREGTGPASPASLSAEHLDRAAPVVSAMESTWG